MTAATLPVPTAALSARPAPRRALDATRAELLRIRRWPAIWVLFTVWTLLQVTFSFAFPYIAYRSNDPDAFGGAPSPEVLIAQLLPDAVPVTLVQGTPMFGGAIALILGALSVGSGYAWGTWKTVLTQTPTRLEAVAGTLAAVAACIAGLPREITTGTMSS